MKFIIFFLLPALTFAHDFNFGPSPSPSIGAPILSSSSFGTPSPIMQSNIPPMIPTTPTIGSPAFYPTLDNLSPSPVFQDAPNSLFTQPKLSDTLNHMTTRKPSDILPMDTFIVSDPTEPVFVNPLGIEACYQSCTS